jgi:hypothetical protein
MAQTRKDDAKLERVCVSTWSFHTLFPNDSAKPAKPLDLLEFPEMIADHYHVHNLEVVAPHFASTESSYFQEFQTRLKRAHSRLVNIPIDIAELWEKPSLSSPDSGVREHAISLYSKWIDRAHELGAPSVRCDPGTIDLADLAPTIASYKTLVTYARARNIDLIVENHGTAAQGIGRRRFAGLRELPGCGNPRTRVNTVIPPGQGRLSRETQHRQVRYRPLCPDR